ncbi:hypothetical protein BGZ76_004672 [Entomortierella beljakovae]|nr:hypothetical protein BGZ76_004672 [Entomortierella beljakovae]
MDRQRSLSVSSMGALAKLDFSLMTSLSTSVALYDNQYPPKTLQDILLLAQSHYISHRYVPALTLYKLAAEKHHSLPACCSLYALYTSTLNTQGLVKSDTKATQILIHALRIWTARRWSSSRLVGYGSTRSRVQDEIDELEEYFAHPRNPTKSHRRQAVKQPVSIPISNQSKARPSQPKNVALSIESEYRKPFHLQDDESDLESVSDQDDSQDEDEYDSEVDDDDESYISSDDCEECDEKDEEAEKEEEARRIGLATDEIEDIVQKICSMIQKGVLGLDEPVLLEAVSSLRVIERGLNREAEVWKRELESSKSMFSLEVPSDKSISNRPNLLLTQGIDLSFLNFSPEEDNRLSSMSAQPISERTRINHQRNPTLSSITTLEKSDPVNQAIVCLPSGERERDRALCRSIRIRVMFTLGWVHQQKGEYDYGAKAFGVCSEIASTGKRPLNIMQLQAKANIETCKTLERQTQEPIKVMEPIQITEQRKSDSHASNCPELRVLTMPPRPSQKSSALPETPTSAVTLTSVSTSMSGNPSDISSPSSMTSSDSGSMSIRGSNVISSLSAAMWGSGFFKLSPGSNPTSESGTSTPKLHRSKSMVIESKIKPLDTIISPKETKEPQQHHHTHHHHHHPKQQHRSKTSRSSAPVSGNTAPVLTMSVHQKKAVECGHCGQSRILMPLCACKKVRYCNGGCRVADLEKHRLTGCYATKIGGSTVGFAASDSTSSAKSGVTI